MKKSHLYSLFLVLSFLMVIFLNTSIEARNDLYSINLSNLSSIAEASCSEEPQGPVCIIEEGVFCCTDPDGWFIWGWRIY